MQSKIGVAILRAIEQSAEELTGSPLVDARVARDSMAMALASLLEARSGLESDDDMIDAVRLLAGDIYAYAKSLRANFEKTGQRAWARIALSDGGPYALQ